MNKSLYIQYPQRHKPSTPINLKAHHSMKCLHHFKQHWMHTRKSKEPTS